MYMLAGLRTLFLKALNNDLNHDHYTKLALIEQWNKECDKVYEYKNEIVREVYYKTAPKVGTWRLQTDEEEPNPMFKLVVCSNCNKTANSTYDFCPECGADMKGNSNAQKLSGW